MQTTSLSMSTRATSRSGQQELRARRVQTRMQLKATLFISLAPCSQGMDGQDMTRQAQDENAFLQQKSMLATAATYAANAAERASGLLSQSSTADSYTISQGAGALQAASRILENPDVFTGDDLIAFSGWKLSFCSWLSFGDQRFEKCFDELDKLSPTDEIHAYSEVECELSVKFFAILASYLRGRCVGIVKRLAKSKDGFRMFSCLACSHSGVRALQPAKKVCYCAGPIQPSFFQHTKTILEQILAYEQLVQHFEKISSSTYPSELRVAARVKCSGQKLREYLQLTIGEHSTYSDLKEIILGYDKACRSWKPETVLKSLQDSLSSDQNGPQPMED